LQAVSHLPQVGAYDDIVKTAEANGIPIATTNSFDPGILSRNGISHTGQDAIASATSAQATSIREVNRAVEDLDKMNQHNTTLVEETNASVEQAEVPTAELDRVVDLFTIDDAAAEPIRRRALVTLANIY
jgi:methyl-accepting chemotaxis protein